MAFEGSVTKWLGQLKAGDDDAAQAVWERYFGQLVRLARRKLKDSSRVVADEEDVALSAFNNFCLAAKEGRYPKLNDRHGLWRMLVVIAERKAHDQIRDAHRLKRGHGRVWRESALADGDSDPVLNQRPALEPTPEIAALMTEEFERLLDSLGDDRMRTLALMKMEGYEDKEIAVRLGCALRTVERKLSLIRDLWSREVA